MRTGPLILNLLIIAACTSSKPAAPPAPAPAAAPPTPVQPVVPETVTVTVRDPDLDRRVARLDLRVLEKEAQVAELQTRLDDTRDEVVRTMSKLQTLSSRAEAASGIAEAEVALQTLRGRVGAQHPDAVEVARLVQQSSAEFAKSNFGGAFYLASQAKAQATAARARIGDSRGAARPGETAFAVPIRLKVSGRGNVREGPGTTFAVVYSVEGGATLTAFSYTEDWIRVTDDSGRVGWIYRALIGRP